jgi:type I restriction enzyme, R subunit
MANIISEDHIEQNIIKVFKEMGYRHLNAFYGLKERLDERKTVIEPVLRERLILLNPTLPASAIDTAVQKLTESRASQTAYHANVVLYDLMKAGVTVDVIQPNGKTEPKTVRIIDFENTKNNDFLVISQLYIQGSLRQRPDLIVFVNGLPLIFIELKNSNVPVKDAYDDNLTNYKKFIPQLFNHNALLILSNGIETKVGSITSEWNHFFPWLRPMAENEEPDLKRIKEDGISLEYAVRGLCEPVKFLDYFQNFILYHTGSAKIVAKNHQFLGVNNVIESFKNRLVHDAENTDTNNKGKLGVFWHTQGSGKSFSMVFLTKKIGYKFTGNYTFLIVTDREDLDGQIKKNYYKAGVISEKETKSQPASSEALRTKLQENHQYIFTLIHKFRYEKGKTYPVLSNRNDIIVIVDEAHRTQYKDLADNMRKGLPNAQFLAFTGTPLLGSKKLTNQWFGKLVSEYNFKQSIEDGATVPLFYQNRKPKVNLQNDDLNDEFAEIVTDEELTDEQLEKLERDYAKELSVIRADDRLNTIAEDIVKHFPRRGYLGKAMVISIDKFTAVRMYDKVKNLWDIEIRKIKGEIQAAKTEEEKQELKNISTWMKAVDMAVVISEEAGEIEKFKKQDLDIEKHRNRLNSVDEDIEDKFKDPKDSLSMVFVCSMWLTGFDAPTISTLYLDKPMKDHTLMQTIARANRTSDYLIYGKEKKNGLVIDYYGVFRNLKKAFASYGGGSTESGGADFPIQEKSQLFVLLQQAIDECTTYCKTLEIDLSKILTENVVFEKLGLFNEYANTILLKEEQKKLFFVYENTVEALYEACRPEISQRKSEFRMRDVIHYLRNVIDGKAEQSNIENAKRKVNQLLNESIISDGEKNKSFEIKTQRRIDLSKLDIEILQKEFKEAPYKNIEIADLKAFIISKLEQMIAVNTTRSSFAEKLAEIIRRYNEGKTTSADNGGITPDDYFSELMDFVNSMKEEDLRAKREGLSEEELEIFDLLKKQDLQPEEKEKVKDAAKTLLKRLREESPKVLVTDWFKDTQTKKQVENVINTILNSYLPESYTRPIYKEKCDNIFAHFYTQAIGGQQGRA